MFLVPQASRMIMTLMNIFALFVFVHCYLLYKPLLLYISSHKLEYRQVYQTLIHDLVFCCRGYGIHGRAKYNGLHRWAPSPEAYITESRMSRMAALDSAKNVLIYTYWGAGARGAMAEFE